MPPRPPRARQTCRRLLLAVLAAAMAACQPADSPSALEPQGAPAQAIAFSWWVMFWLGLVIYLGVMAFLALGLWRRWRERPTGDEAPPPPLPVDARGELPGGPMRWVVGGGIVMPAVVLVVLYLLTLGTLRAIANTSQQALVIEVVGHQWWWEVRYPDHDIVTANEIHIPAGTPVTLNLTTADVIHSFWVPELHGKIDMTPGHPTSMVLHAENPGEFRGQCAEFCGVQHAKMALLVVADTPADFEAWIARQQQPAPKPADDETRQGEQVFLGSACVYCHTVRGTNASGTLGPDLTHLASRRTLGAAAVLNTRGHLAGWIVDPQSIKPGNKMPPTDLSGAELQALLAYLDTLE